MINTCLEGVDSYFLMGFHLWKERGLGFFFPIFFTVYLFKTLLFSSSCQSIRIFK